MDECGIDGREEEKDRISIVGPDGVTLVADRDRAAMLRRRGERPKPQSQSSWMFVESAL